MPLSHLRECLETKGLESTMAPAEGWALGDHFTTADIVFGGTLDFAIQFGWLDAPTEKVADYVRRLKARDAYRASHDPSWH